MRVNISSVAVQPTTEIALNVNLPTDDVEAGADGAARAVTVEYFDNVGGSQALTASFAPTVPAAGDPRSNEWTLTLTDQASGAGGRHLHARLQRHAAERRRPRQRHRPGRRHARAAATTRRTAR